MRLTTVFCSALVVAGMALQASAVIGWANIQWPTVGSNQPNSAPITVYSKVWKDGCTPGPGPCPALIPMIYFKAPSDGSFTSAPMVFQGEDGPSNDEFRGEIALSAMGESTVEFYVEYLDADDGTLYYPDGYDAVSPAFYNLIPSTASDFTLTVCVDLTCIGVGDPGASGSFNGWSFTGLDPTGDPNVWCGDFVIPAGSSPDVYFKFRNPAIADWEDCIGDRTYSIAPGATQGSYDAFWCNDDSCLSADTEDQPGNFALAAAYPNPFNPSTNIDFSIAQTDHVTLSITDLLGRTVATLVDESIAAGEHSVVFDAASLSSGVYFYTLESAGMLQTRKMVLLK